MGKKSARTAKNTLKMDCVTELMKYAFYIVGLKMFSSGRFNLETYSGTLEVIISSNISFHLIHFFMNVIAMFVSEIRDSRCRSTGVKSGISGHDIRSK